LAHVARTSSSVVTSRRAAAVESEDNAGDVIMRGGRQIADSLKRLIEQSGRFRSLAY
jgi:hypothetical protein